MLFRSHALWDEAFALLGAHIRVVHMKGICVQNNMLQKAEFADSVVDYAYIFRKLRTLKHEIHVIREEVKPAFGKADVTFLRALAQNT